MGEADKTDMEITDTGKDRWLTKLDLLDEFLKKDDWSDKAIKKLLSYTSSIAFPCDEGKIEHQTDKNMEEWIRIFEQFVTPYRALSWWIGEKCFPDEDARRNLCRKKCINFELCEKMEAKKDKMVLCINAWQKVGEEFKAIIK